MPRGAVCGLAVFGEDGVWEVDKAATYHEPESGKENEDIVLEVRLDGTVAATLTRVEFLHLKSLLGQEMECQHISTGLESLFFSFIQNKAEMMHEHFRQLYHIHKK